MGSGDMEKIMKQSSNVVVNGPLEAHLEGYRHELSRRGYSSSATIRHLQLMAHLSRWLMQNDVDPADFDQQRHEHFLADRRASGYVRFRTSRGLMPIVDYLRSQGVVPGSVPSIPVDPDAILLEGFVNYLYNERSLAESTVVWHRRVASSFLRASQSADNGNNLIGLTAGEVHAFVLAECSRRSVGSANNVVSALRALLRFLYLQGHVASPLADSVPRVATWRDGGRSKALSDRQIDALLTSCDRRRKAGRRDFAILTVLARLGLRAAEVASLTLDDIYWRSGEVAVTGKGNRADRLPLPNDVGRALAEYCERGRARNTCRALFLHVRAPYGALSPSAVSHVVLRASERAGIAPVRAHRLRHSVASMMRRAGAPLFEIGQVLRHGHMTTTAVYAKDDLDALAGIARPWPGALA